MRVLLVEDERRLAASLEQGLKADGFAVDVAFDGTDGLWMAREHRYDAIVLDIMLPEVSGYTICATLREEQVVSKRDILNHVWDDDFDGDPNIVEVYIRYLRKKIDIPFGRNSIETIRGAGYRLVVDSG